MMLALAATTLMGSRVALAASAAESDGDVDVALKKLYDTVPGGKVLAARARGILVFPNIVKGGFIIGAQYGDVALRKNNQTVGYYNTVAASYGLQAGVQTFGYALFFMTDAALAYLHSSDGWEIGVGRVLSSWRPVQLERSRPRPPRTRSMPSASAQKV